MQHVPQQLEAVDEPRTGPREVRRGVDRDDAPRPDARSSSANGSASCSERAAS